MIHSHASHLKTISCTIWNPSILPNQRGSSYTWRTGHVLSGSWLHATHKLLPHSMSSLSPAPGSRPSNPRKSKFKSQTIWPLLEWPGARPASWPQTDKVKTIVFNCKKSNSVAKPSLISTLLLLLFILFSLFPFLEGSTNRSLKTRD